MKNGSGSNYPVLNLVVVDNPKSVDLQLPNVEVISARTYITSDAYGTKTRARVFNLCRSYKYQSIGYYVSLLAEARGHRPLPSIDTINDLRVQPVIRVAGQDLLDKIARSLKPLKSDEFEVSIYFGRNTAARYDALSNAIFNQFPAPLLRARFGRTLSQQWELDSVRLIGLAEVPDSHVPFLIESAARYFEKTPRRRTPKPAKYALAILYDPEAKHQPSNERAIKRFVEAAEARSMRAELIERDAYGRLSEFDALFIRETTAVNHHTYRISRRARAQGLVVVDDPESILRCTNKVFLKELLERHRLAIPRSIIITEDSAGLVAENLGFPCVVKRPDESFSTGVHKFETQEAFDTAKDELFRTSELLIVQEFMPTSFDWRVGILNRTPLFACRYHMARRHWQIVKHTAGDMESGAVDSIPVDQAPSKVIALATQAASLIGNGLYGVDIKEVNGRPYVIEINDNPNIDAGYEDQVLKDELYDRVIRYFIEQIEARRAARV